MKKKIYAVIMATLISSALVIGGCGNNETSDNNGSNETQVETTEETASSETDNDVTDEVENESDGTDEASESSSVRDTIYAGAEWTTDVNTVDMLSGQLLEGKYHVSIDVQDYGTIELELDADAAPVSVTNFILLTRDGFYDGLTFHRIMDGFMIQGGDPLGNGTGGADYSIMGEFAANGVPNDISHVRGTVAMARNSTDYNSGSSQFFIVHEDSTFLDGNYAAFGHVTSGMEVVDAIAKAATPTDDNGTIPAEEQPLINCIKLID